MNIMRKVRIALLVSGLIGALTASVVLAYETAPVADGAVLSGKIVLKGKAPAPRKFELGKFPNSDFCGTGLAEAGALHMNVGVEMGKNDKGEPAAVKGERELREVGATKDGLLKDVVVVIQGIEKGKALTFKGTDVKGNNCRFLVQGPSQYVGVVMKKAEVRFDNDDNVMHNPHGYEVAGPKRDTMFNNPLNGKQKLTKEVKLRKSPTMKVECDQHNFMQVWFYAIDNPYYAVVGEDGTFSIDDVPPGKYKVVAWHPILGTQEQEVTLAAKGKASATFEFKAQ